MNVVFFGNTNNLPLSLALEMRRLGHDARLIVNERAALHRPENLVPAWKDRYPDWIRDMSHIEEDDLVCQSLRISPVLEMLDSAETLILNGLGPSLMNLLRRRPTLVLLTGSDLDYNARFSTLARRSAGWSEAFKVSAVGRLQTSAWRQCITRQRAGIKMADYVSYFPRGFVPEGDALLDDIGVPDRRRVFVYFGDFSPTPLPEAPAHTGLRIFCGARVTWMKPLPPEASVLDAKGTDLLLHGFARFCASTDTDVELRLVEKGWHVAEAKGLLEKLGIAERVTWLKEMDRVEFRNELIRADIVVDQLDSSVIGMAGLEAMATGRPLIAAAHNRYWMKRLGQVPPVCHADSADSVCAQLQRLAGDADLRRRIGAESAEFVRKHWSVRAAAETGLKLMNQASSSFRGRWFRLRLCRGMCN